MPAVLSIQSWVACGAVGNCAALFPLQRLGIETWSLNTVAFSNHTGYGKWRGEAIPAPRDRRPVRGHRRAGGAAALRRGAVGLSRRARIGPLLLDIVARVKQANPRALYCCDPVMGDVGPGWYVRAGIPDSTRDRALALADIATPNRFELEWLTGRPIGSVAEAGEAAAALRRLGPGIVLVTSLETAADRVAVVAAGADGAWAVETPRLPIEATGCGDALAALFLGWLLKGKPLPEALAATVAAIWGVVEATFQAGGGELALIAAQDELVSPSRVLLPQKL